MSGIKVTGLGRPRPLLTGESGEGVVVSDGVDFDTGPYGVAPSDQDAWKQPVVAATTGAITVATDLNDGDILDGVTLGAGNRVLVKDQAGEWENGIYVVGSSPQRSSDMDDDDEVVGAMVFVLSGTTNVGLTFRADNTEPPVIGVDDITFSVLGSPATIPDGTYELATEGGQSVIKAHGSMGATETFDPADGNVHTGTLTANCTVTLNAPTGSGACTLELRLTQDSSGGWSITWPVSVTEQGTLDTSADAVNTIVLETLDGGSSWVAWYIGGSGAVGELDDLTDVTIATPQENDTLRYVGGEWVNDNRQFRPVTHDFGSGPELVWDGDDLVMEWF